MSSPDIIFYLGAGAPIALFGWIYRRGLRRRTTRVDPIDGVRHVGFAIGLSLFGLSLQWPFARWAHQSFFIHQIGLLIARILAPMLLVFARPSALLISGLPRWARASLLKPTVSNPSFRRFWHRAGSAPAAMVLYVGSLYLWELPAAQAAALAHTAAGLAMHLSLMSAGLLFWSRIFARRPAPHGISYGRRLMMMWLAILVQLPLGAFLTVKREIFYPAYAAGQAAAGISPIADEAKGGFIVWIPSALLSLVALMIVIALLGRHENNMDERRRRWSPSNSAILQYPESAAALRELARPANRQTAIGMCTFGIAVFLGVCAIASFAHQMERRENTRLYDLSKR